MLSSSERRSSERPCPPSNLPRMDTSGRHASQLRIPQAIETTASAYLRPEHCETDVRERLTAYRNAVATRDDLVLEAKDLGLSEVEISQLSGHSRNTVRTILRRKKAG